MATKVDRQGRPVKNPARGQRTVGQISSENYIVIHSNKTGWDVDRKLIGFHGEMKIDDIQMRRPRTAPGPPRTKVVIGVIKLFVD